MQGRVLIIAGSDSGGGAGIQGDIKTVTCLGAYAATAITALTAQNTQGVFGILDVPDDFIRKQITLVLDDIGADAFKTGMLHKSSVIETVADTLTPYLRSPLGGEQARASLSAARAVGGNMDIIRKARELRKNLTPPERKLWQHLSQRQLEGFKFRRQQPIGGKYIADFACLEQKLIIELDGSHHMDQHAYDQSRDWFLNNEGYRVIRIWNNEVFENIEGVLASIKAAIYTPHGSTAAPIGALSCPLPPKGGASLVLDPVMFAKGGAALLDPAAISILKTRLIPMAAIITPNIPEAEYLAGIPIGGTNDMQRAADIILKLGCGAVLIKGGHLAGDIVTDMLVSKNDVEIFTQPRIETPHTHGTGCATASAIATGLAQGMVLSDAVKRAREYVRKAILAAPGLGKGHGPLGHAHTVI